MAKTIIVGGGVIGLASAFELHRRGSEVTVLDMGDFGAACSSGNAGWITPSLSAPVPAPGLVLDSMKWMLSRDSPLYIKPAAVPQLAPWLFRFWRHCNPRDYQAGFEATVRLGQNIMQQYDSLVDAGVEFEMHQTGLLYAFMDLEYMKRASDELMQMQQFGYQLPVIMHALELHDFEPSLTDRVMGGVWVREERHVRPETLTAGLVGWLAAAGVDLRSHVEVTGLRRQGDSIRAVETAAGTLEADEVLIAAGAWSGELAAMAGVGLPMQAGKGYNITVQQPEIEVRHSIYFSEARIACTPFNDALRLAGTMEMSGINTELDTRRVDAIRRGADRVLKNWRRGAGETTWAGMRPMTPDGLPVIGRAPGYDNLFFATGHAMMGVSLAPATAAVIADVMRGDTPDMDLAPFDPARFARRSTLVSAQPTSSTARSA